LLQLEQTPSARPLAQLQSGWRGVVVPPSQQQRPMCRLGRQVFVHTQDCFAQATIMMLRGGPVLDTGLRRCDEIRGQARA